MWIRDLIRRYGRSLSSDLRMLLDQYRVVDMARKVVGVGSVGTRCWIVLLVGRDEQDPLFLQIKEANRSVLADFAGESPYRHQGHRVVAGQRLMQAVGDIMLGWKRAEDTHGGSHDFYVRQLRDWKGILEPRAMVPHSMRIYRRTVRHHPRARPRPLLRPHRHRRLPRQRRGVRPRDRPVRRSVRRPEREGSPGARRRGRPRPRGRAGILSRSVPGRCRPSNEATLRHAPESWR